MTPELFDRWRIMSRILMTTYYMFFMFSFVWISDWFMTYDFNALENETIALTITGFPVAILTVLSGVLSMLTKNYFNSGNYPTHTGASE